MKTLKMKWPVREMLIIRYHKLLKEWLRYVETLKAIEEELVQICEPEIGESLNDLESKMRSIDDLMDYQEGREEEIPVFHEGNDKRSLRDLKDCQEGSRSISDCQVGRDEHMRLSEGLMDSVESSI
jgi:hypothetical protein